MGQYSIEFLIVPLVLLLSAILPFLYLKFKHRKTKVIVNPIDEAKIYIAYGRNKQAKDILRKQLEANPHDTEAIALLNEISSK